MESLNAAAIAGSQTVKQWRDLYVVRTVRLSTGEHLPLLVARDSGIPETYVLRYTLAVLRSPGLSSNTMELHLAGVGAGLSFLHQREIDLVQRIAEGSYLLRDELSSFADRCLSRADGKGSVVAAYARHRYAAFMQYIEWRTEPVLLRSNAAQRRHLKEELKEFKTRARAQQPKGSAGAIANDRLGLTPAQRELLLEVIRPESPLNPFRPHVRSRNFAMVMLPYTLGMRAGELHGLLRRDYDNSRNPATLMIHRRPNDKEDRRVEPARTKTRARLLEIEGEAQKALDDWLRDRSDRGRFPEARKNSRIFVNSDGEELSLRGARMVFERLRAAYPELAGFCQHVLRHDVNDRLVEQTAERGWDPEEVRADAIYVMGWSETSRMPERYAKSAIRKRANNRILDLQRSDHEKSYS